MVINSNTENPCGRPMRNYELGSHIVCCMQGAMKEATETWKSLSVVEKKVQECI